MSYVQLQKTLMTSGSCPRWVYGRASGVNLLKRLMTGWEGFCEHMLAPRITRSHLSDRELFGRREKVSVAYGRHRVAIVILVRVSSDHWSFYRLRMSWAWCSNDYLSYPNILISYLSTALFQTNVTTVLNLFPPFFISTLWWNLKIIVLGSKGWRIMIQCTQLLLRHILCSTTCDHIHALHCMGGNRWASWVTLGKSM